MPGDDWQKFANLRAYFGFMWSHPGKKLLFMGGEFAQRGEWNHDRGLDWSLLDHGTHLGVQRLVRDLNRLCATEPALYQGDSDADCFEWIDADARAESIFVFLRKALDKDANSVVTVVNFTPTAHRHYRIGVPGPGLYQELLNSDSAIYGGSDAGNYGAVKAEQMAWHGRPWSIVITVPPLATIMFSQTGNL